MACGTMLQLYKLQKSYSVSFSVAFSVVYRSTSVSCIFCENNNKYTTLQIKILGVSKNILKFFGPRYVF